MGNNSMLFSTGCSVAHRMLDLGHQHAITLAGKAAFQLLAPA
jgi:hypothetical protein